ncbi:MAG: hypothetical protein H6622_10855 [Halobacteriovoraceae bacterium]|nr:hypothetical protein [Halobacteriovoraceae bacterium]
MKSILLILKFFYNTKKCLNQKGGTLLTTVVLTAGMTAAAVTILDLTDIGKNQAILALNEDKAQLANSRLLSAAENMISANIIWCREYEGEILENSSVSGKCIWGGDKLKGVTQDESVKAHPNDYNFEIPTSEEIKTEGFENFLTYKFNKYSDNIKSVVGSTYIGFRLVDWSKENTYESLIGGIPPKSLLYDSDTKVVLVKVKTKFTPENLGNDETQIKDEDAKSSIVSYSDVRRPFSELHINAGAADISCAAYCQSNISMDPNFPCRGPQEFLDSKAKVPLVITNKGPGIIYRLSLDVKTTYNPKYYTDKSGTGFHRSLDIVSNTEEPLLPGQTKKITDYVDCKYMKKIVKEERLITQATSNSSLIGKSEDAGTSLEKRQEQHHDDGGQVDYSVEVSCFDLDAANRDEFIVTNVECNSLPDEYKSKSLAVLEPSRIFEPDWSKKYSEIGLPVHEEEFAEVKTIIRFVAVPSH